nr:hypothetical protein Iba_chr08cCG1890 [Ipomoea batatas]
MLNTELCWHPLTNGRDLTTPFPPAYAILHYLQSNHKGGICMEWEIHAGSWISNRTVLKDGVMIEQTSYGAMFCKKTDADLLWKLVEACLQMRIGRLLVGYEEGKKGSRRAGLKTEEKRNSPFTLNAGALRADYHTFLPTHKGHTCPPLLRCKTGGTRFCLFNLTHYLRQISVALN